MVGWNTAFVTERDLCFVPMNTVIQSCQLFVNFFGGGTSGEAETKETAFCDGLIVALKDEFEGCSRKVGGSQDSSAGRSLHGMNALRTAEMEERRVRCVSEAFRTSMRPSLIAV